MNTPIQIGRESTEKQAEFPMNVVVCAWCKPKPGAAVLQVFSHGICPRHLRIMRLKLTDGSRKGT